MRKRERKIRDGVLVLQYGGAASGETLRRWRWRFWKMYGRGFMYCMKVSRDATQGV
jgi:hypothetical protein